MVHILPHWNWPERVGKSTPVHLFTSGDEAELFLNGKSLGKKKKGKYEHRLRWDDIAYQPGELKAVAYKDLKVKTFEHGCNEINEMYDINLRFKEIKKGRKVDKVQFLFDSTAINEIKQLY